MSDSKLFANVETLFKDEILKNSSNDHNICCSKLEEIQIIAISDHLKNVPKYSTLSDRDKMVVLIFALYSLVHGEQTTDYLTTKFLRENLTNKELGKELYREITIGDLVYDGQNLSSLFRRHFFGMTGKGNSRRKNKSKSKKTKKPKQSRKTKTKTKTKRRRTNKK